MTVYSSSCIQVETVTAYKDRTGQSNVFILFRTADDAAAAMATMQETAVKALVWGEDSQLACAVEYAWFEGIQEDTRTSGWKVYNRRKHTSRLRKLGIGQPTAPWAKKRMSAT
jgi:hypothetical protein